MARAVGAPSSRSGGSDEDGHDTDDEEGMAATNLAIHVQERGQIYSCVRKSPPAQYICSLDADLV